MDNSKKRGTINWKNIILLQGIIIIYTMAGVAGKYASRFNFFSLSFILCYGVEIIILGIYAVLWQQIIKRFDLTVAYANRSIAIIWSMLWALLLFHESISVQNMIGVVLILIGTMVVNGDSNE